MKPLSHSAAPRGNEPTTTPAERQLMAAIQHGLPTGSRPYLTLARQLGRTESWVIDTLQHWIDSGLIKRFGLVVNHHNLGYQHSAMAVWDVPDDQVDELGAAIGATGLVSLCYQRARQRPQWPYNLYCMIHAKSGAHVNRVLDQLNQHFELNRYPGEVLFTTGQLKQCGGNYGGR